MKELLSKLSNYNLFNYLFPGVIFVIILKKLTRYDLTQEDIIVGAFFYYFIGLVISRIGSVTVEPFLKWIHFVKFANYPQFIEASKNDSKIELLSEANNMYRTFISVFLITLAIKIFEIISLKLKLPPKTACFAVIIFLLILFLSAYKKQTAYISKRVQSALTINDSNET